MPERAAPAHVQEAIDTAAAADEAFAEVNVAVADYREARDESSRAQDRVLRDYTAAERRRTGG